jgi:hypothetical protein
MNHAKEALLQTILQKHLKALVQEWADNDIDVIGIAGGAVTSEYGSDGENVCQVFCYVDEAVRWEDEDTGELQEVFDEKRFMHDVAKAMVDKPLKSVGKGAEIALKSTGKAS